MTYSPSDVASGRASPRPRRACRAPATVWWAPNGVVGHARLSRRAFLVHPTTWPNYSATPRECGYAFNLPRRSPCASLGYPRACHSPVTSPLTPQRAPRCALQRLSPAMGSRRLANRRRVHVKALALLDHSST